MTTGKIFGIVFGVGLLLIILGGVLSPSHPGSGMAIGAWFMIWFWLLVAYAIYYNVQQSKSN